ncbi:hypothetical protein AMTRI_Chr12g269530 [Amborella trichopoda]
MFRIEKKLQMLKKKLKVWNQNIFENELQDVVGTNSIIDEDELMAKTKVHNGLAIQEKSGLPSCSMNNDLFNLMSNTVDLVDNNFLEIHCWDIVKYDICQAEQGADTLFKFRPIFMGSFIFKIIPKILANRLRVIAPNLISEEQGAFLKGRHISSNICMASELLNSFKKKLHAYDSPFLLEVLKRFGFTAKFVSWVKQILHSANISVERGLKQADYCVGSKNKISKIKVILWVNSSIQTICYQKIVYQCFLEAPKARLLRSLLERICDKLSVSWDRVCKPINDGGLGLRRLRDVNFSILMNLFFSKYFKEDASMKSTPRSLLNSSLASQSGLPLSAFKNSKARVSHFISGNSSMFIRDKGRNSYWNSLVWYKGINTRIRRLRSRHLSGNSMETKDHVFVTCTFANSTWSWSGFGGILRESSRVVLGYFSRPIPIRTNYLAELNLFIYGVEYVIRKGITNVWIEFLIADGYAVGDNI